MPQVSLYVDDQLMSELRASAEREGTSLSKHVANRLKSQTERPRERSGTPSGLPEGYFERLFGCVDDDSFTRPPQVDYVYDAARISFQ